MMFGAWFQRSRKDSPLKCEITWPQRLCIFVFDQWAPLTVLCERSELGSGQQICCGLYFIKTYIFVQSKCVKIAIKVAMFSLWVC